MLSENDIWAQKHGWYLPGADEQVYFNDMVIKSHSEEMLIQDVEEAFQTLLNPAKCTFGVEEGKFLGYQVTREGILPNPTKI
uniref:Uncharacterized protein n=1 Tax=Lactuca sativa TaxID=4236 RepID=A0A9R1WAN9_LACSA|nr:hypothetical protein LSAT_V11C300145150 [Lactuca sativa]